MIVQNVAGGVPRSCRGVARVMIDLLLPRRCMCCDQQIGGEDGLCADCWARMPFLERPWCHRLGIPFSHDVGPDGTSPQAIVAPPLFDRLRSAASYDGPAQDLVKNLKFARRRELSSPMGHWMARAGEELLSKNTLVVPVPLHWMRLWQRRFNQAGELGRSVAQWAQCDFIADLLVRSKPTRQQVGLSAKQRQSNVRKAFRVNPRRQQHIHGRSVVLVDDVYTTGSTVGACTKVLLAEGAASVDVLTFAQASLSGRGEVILTGG